MPRGPPSAPPIGARSSDVEPLRVPRATRVPRPACGPFCLTSITWIHSVCRWFGWSRWPVRAQGSPLLEERGNIDPDGSASIGGPCHPAVRGWREPTKIPRSASCRAQDTSFSETGLLECQSWTRLEPDPRPASTRAATPGRRARRRPDGRNPRRCAPPPPAPAAPFTRCPLSSKTPSAGSRGSHRSSLRPWARPSSASVSLVPDQAGRCSWGRANLGSRVPPTRPHAEAKEAPQRLEIRTLGTRMPLARGEETELGLGERPVEP
jgi:hypothetical protein